MAMLTRTGTNPLSFFGGFGGDQFFDELQGFGPGYGQGFGMGMMPFQGQQTLAQPKLAVISVDVCEKGDSYELHASLPGVPKENVKVDVDGDVIRISTEYKKETQDESPEDTEPSCRWHRVERVSEYATRALRMPEQADLSTIDASMDGGVLIVKVPKKLAAVSKARRVAIA